MVRPLRDRGWPDAPLQDAYAALVWGVPRPAKGEIEGNIGRSPHHRQKMTVRREGGRHALTRYAVIRRFGTVASLVECRLATGRTHQIRVHLSHKGHPVIGDTVYGGGMTSARRRDIGTEVEHLVSSLERQALHAKLLGFSHPGTGEQLRFESKIPYEINELIRSLEKI